MADDRFDSNGYQPNPENQEGGNPPGYQPPANPYQQPTNPYQQPAQPTQPVQPTGNPYQPAEGSAPYQPQPQPYMNQAPGPYIPDAQPARGLAIAGLVLGILGVLCCCMNWVGLIFGIPGLILSIIARSKGNRSGLSMAALIVSIVGVVLSLAMLIYIFAILGSDPDIWGSIMDGTFDPNDFLSNY